MFLSTMNLLIHIQWVTGPAEVKNVWGAVLSVRQTTTTLILENFGGAWAPLAPPVPPARQCEAACYNLRHKVSKLACKIV